MNVKYFKDTDTALLKFSARFVEETREIGENIYLDLDKNGNLVRMTIEHAGQNASFPSGVVEQIEQGAAKLLARNMPRHDRGGTSRVTILAQG